MEATGPASASPWRAKRGHFRNVAVEGGPFGEKQIFEKKSQCPTTERGTLWDFKHPICCKISKKLKGGPFGEKKILEKSLTMPKNRKGDPFGFSNIHSDAKKN